MRLAPIALSALAMLGFLEANRRAEANPFSEEESVEPIAPVETAAPAAPQPKAAIAPPEPIQTAPQARSTAPRAIEKAAQKAEKVAASAPNSQVTPPPAPAPERIAVSAPATTPAPAAPATAAPDLTAPPVSRPVSVAQPENASGAVAQPVAQRVEREAPMVAVAAVAESKPAALSSQESTPPVRAIAPRLAERQTVPTAAMTSDATAGPSAPLPVAAIVADATVERSAPLPSTPVDVSAPAEVTNVIVAPAVPVTFVEPTTPRISYSGLIPLLKDDPLNDPREFRPGSMHMETLPVVESPSTGPSLATESSLTADGATPSLSDTRLAAESRSDRHEAAVRSCLGENPNLFRLVEQEEGRFLQQVLYNGQPGRIARGTDGRLVCPSAAPVAQTVETTPGVQAAVSSAEAPVAIAPVEAEVVTEGTSHRRHRYYYGYTPYYPPVVVSYPRPVVVERPVTVVVERPRPVVIERPVPVVVERPVPIVVERPAPILLPHLPVLEIRYDRRTRRALRRHPYRLVHYHYPYYYPHLAYGGWPYPIGLREENADPSLSQPGLETEGLGGTTHRFEGTVEAAAPAEIPTLSVSTGAADVAIAPSGSRTAAPVYARANESVVAIRNRFSGSGFFVEPASGPGGNPNTLIVTNAHVVENLQQGQVSRVTLADNSDRRARLVGFDPSGTDLALLTLEPSRYPNLDRLSGQKPTFTGQPLRLADARSVQPGDPAYVIGTPFGQERFRNALTSGVVSKINPDEVLTDAQINPGNSGGPVLDQHGNVIGVVALSFSRGGNRGLSSAISSDRVRHLLASAHTGHLASTAPLSRVTNATPLSFGQDSHGFVARAEGRIDEGDRLSDNGRRFETFSFQLPTPAQVSIQMRSAFIDSFLALRRDVSRFNDQTALEPVAENDDANANTLDSAIRANLPAGTYVVFAGSYGAGEAGPYDLNVRVTSQGTRVATPARRLAEENAVTA
ncbi:trypsin-like peptidase domain-containing protein [Thermoleptolyngbya sp. M55_K2018_002]|uniref:S1C family serine protease n=1 Tax=Thermoleptolyngbya sp. M55_K2018_002 TaxID=2747808 RepID=UPI001A087821|nr:trypsin-like peptidase domain-containing protein [Thermoleptolyngbya sp. M55_K2018_002]HIK42242.1 trypsin-like peptidase domain-containing protein [Thermoleptolyngbya sp. M55_K2018_002]